MIDIGRGKGNRYQGGGRGERHYGNVIGTDLGREWNITSSRDHATRTVNQRGNRAHQTLPHFCLTHELEMLLVRKKKKLM